MNGKLRMVLIAVFSIVLIYSAVRIVITEIGYKNADAIYDKSRSEHFYVSESVVPLNHETVETEEYFPDVYVNFEDLKTANPDIVGWIWIPDTDVSFPLLHAEDNLKYLGYSYNMQKTSSGSIFMDYRNSPDFSDNNTVIYGHNMNNGGMFGNLKKFSETDYLKEHCDMYIFTETRILKYQVFAAYRTENDSKSYTFDFSVNPDFKSYIEYALSCAGDNSHGAPTEEAPLIMLSTCTSVRRSERFVVHASLIAEKEYKEASLAAQ